MSEFTTLPTCWRRPLAGLGAVLVAILLLYAHTAANMASIWARSNAYSHGFLVPIISLWLIWRMRHSLETCVPKPAPLALLFMLGAACLWLAGDLMFINAVTQLALVMLMVLAVPSLLGWTVAFAMAFPLGFVFFAVPIGDFMTPTLMQWTADFTVLALRLSGIPVYREGLQFVIPSGSWSVVEACSGIRYMMASVTVGCLFAYLTYRSLSRRVVFIGVSILVPLVANWLRAYLVVLIGHVSGNEYGTGFDHIVGGWVFFGFVIFVMLFIGARWSEPQQTQCTPDPATTSKGPVAETSRSFSGSALAALIALGIVASPLVILRMPSLNVSNTPVSLAPLAARSPWKWMSAPIASWEPLLQTPSAMSHTRYLDPTGRMVGVYLAYYREQDYQRKLIGSGNVLVKSDDEHWAQESLGNATTALAGDPLVVATATLRRQNSGLLLNTDRIQVWRFYWVNGRFTASAVQAKVQGALSRLTGRGDDGAHVVIYTPIGPQVSGTESGVAADAILQEFLLTQGPELERALQQTRGGS